MSELNGGVGSQIEVTSKIREMARRIEGEGLEYVKNASGWIQKYLEFREPNASPEEVQLERRIRWRRTADRILEDGYVYKGKACTDVTVGFQALCEARGYKTRFVKVKRKEGGEIHSMAEVEFGDGWYLVDVQSASRGGIRKGELKKGEEVRGWELWRKGRDAWDLGLTSFGVASLVK